jgi:hypothetical protein
MPCPKRINARGSISRVLSSRSTFSSNARCATIPLGGTLLYHSSNQPGRLGRRMPTPCEARRPYSVLLPVGFTMPPMLPLTRCAFTTPFRPYHAKTWRYNFCGTVPEAIPKDDHAGSYPAPFLAGARTFLSHAVSCVAAAARPSGNNLIAV